MVKALFYFMYCVAGGILSYFLPENSRFTVGFIMAVIADWAWKVIKSDSTKEVPNG